MFSYELHFITHPITALIKHFSYYFISSSAVRHLSNTNQTNHSPWWRIHCSITLNKIDFGVPNKLARVIEVIYGTHKIKYLWNEKELFSECVCTQTQEYFSLFVKYFYLSTVSASLPTGLGLIAGLVTLSSCDGNMRRELYGPHLLLYRRFSPWFRDVSLYLARRNLDIYA